jgi:hypothetical protein
MRNKTQLNGDSLNANEQIRNHQQRVCTKCSCLHFAGAMSGKRSAAQSADAKRQRHETQTEDHPKLNQLALLADELLFGSSMHALTHMVCSVVLSCSGRISCSERVRSFVVGHAHKPLQQKLRMIPDDKIDARLYQQVRFVMLQSLHAVFERKASTISSLRRAAAVYTFSD